MEEKDRLGQKLHDKGKGDEDRFFAEQERRKLEKLRESMVPRAGGCPRDGTKLVSSTQDGVTIDTCPSCRGLWLDKGELEALMARNEEPAVTRWVRSLLER